MQHPMTYRSICTGIAAETVAWHPLGWKALSFAEIDPFCCTLLKHRYPEVPNHGDFTKIQAQAAAKVAEIWKLKTSWPTLSGIQGKAVAEIVSPQLQPRPLSDASRRWSGKDSWDWRIITP